MTVGVGYLPAGTPRVKAPLKGHERPRKQGSLSLVLRPNKGGIPEITVCRILMFMWP